VLLIPCRDVSHSVNGVLQALIPAVDAFVKDLDEVKVGVVQVCYTSPVQGVPRMNAMRDVICTHQFKVSGCWRSISTKYTRSGE
jgi:hypothetical protein